MKAFTLFKDSTLAPASKMNYHRTSDEVRERLNQDVVTICRAGGGSYAMYGTASPGETSRKPKKKSRKQERNRILKLSARKSSR